MLFDFSMRTPSLRLLPSPIMEGPWWPQQTSTVMIPITDLLNSFLVLIYSMCTLAKLHTQTQMGIEVVKDILVGAENNY